MEKLFNLVASYIVICFRMYGTPIMATATANSIMIHSIPFHPVHMQHLRAEHNLRLMWFRIMKKIRIFRFCKRKDALSQFLNQTITSKICQSMRPTERPVGCRAGFAEAQNVILFLALFAQQHENCETEKREKDTDTHTHRETQTQQIIPLSHTLYKQPDFRQHSVCSILSSFFCGVYCTQQSVQNTELSFDASRRENKFSNCAQHTQIQCTTDRLQNGFNCTRVGITARSALYTRFKWNAQ